MESEGHFDIAKTMEENICYLMRKRNMLDEDDPEYDKKYERLTQKIADETENLKNIKIGDNEEAQKEAAIRGKNAFIWNALGNIAGNVVGTTIGALFNRQNVKTVTQYEENGGIVNTKAMKFVK